MDIKKTLITTGLVLSMTAACTPTVETRGNLIPEHKQAQIQTMSSTKYDVTQLWGAPTMKSPFDGQTWYYVGKTTEVMGIFKKETIAQQVMKIKFDENDVVSEIVSMDMADAKDIEFVDRTTATAGKEFTVLQQLIGNLGRFNKAPQSME